MNVKRFFSSLLAVLIASSAHCFAQESTSCFVENPSFEVANEKNGPEGWKADANYFNIDLTEAHSGNACLKWTRTGDDYRLCSQSISIKPNDTFHVSAWVKAKDLVDGKAHICVEWNHLDGTWYGGSYFSGIGSTGDDWIKVECRGTMPPDAQGAHVSCYVDKGATGVVYFDDVEISTVIPTLFTAATTNLYRNQSVGGPVDVFVGYTPSIEAVDFQTLSPTLSVVDADGKTLAALKPAEIGYDFYRFKLDSSKLPVAKYSLVCVATDPRKNEKETLAIAFERLEKFPARKAYIDEHKRLIHEGEPVFPLGLYLSGAPQNAIDLIGDSAFNCVMPYAAISREEVDKLYEKGVFTIYSVKDEYPTLRNISMEECDARVKKTVEEFKNCPGVIAWYINDELPTTLVDQLSARRDLMQELDPGRPTWIVLYQVDEYRQYLSTYDVAGSDPYPIPNKPVSLAADWTRKTNQAGFGARAVWQVPQIFDWGSYYQGVNKKDYRAPTLDEMRSMSWQCIAEGANGLIYYSFFDLERMDKTEADGGRAYIAEPFEERWADVKTMAQEIADQNSILTSAGKTLEIAPMTRADVASTRLFGTPEGTWLLVVNKTAEPQTLRFGIPEDAKLVETRLGAPAEQEGESIFVELGAYEPRLILIK